MRKTSKIALGVIGVLALLIILVAAIPDSPKEGGQEQAAAADRVSIGDEAFIFIPGTPESQQAILGTTQENAKDLTKSILANDWVGMLEMRDQGKTFFVEQGALVLVIDRSFGMRKVRVVEVFSEEDEQYLGLAGWVPVEWLSIE